MKVVHVDIADDEMEMFSFPVPQKDGWHVDAPDGRELILPRDYTDEDVQSAIDEWRRTKANGT